MKVEEFNPVIIFPAGGKGVDAVVAAFAVNCAMPFRMVKKRLILRIGAAVTSGAIAARFIEPGRWILSDFRHGAVAVDASHALLL